MISITFCLNPLFLIRDGRITPVEVLVDKERRRVAVVFGPNGARTRCHQEGKGNKVLGDVGPNTYSLHWSFTRRCGELKGGS